MINKRIKMRTFYLIFMVSLLCVSGPILAQQERDFQEQTLPPKEEVASFHVDTLTQQGICSSIRYRFGKVRAIHGLVEDWKPT